MQGCAKHDYGTHFPTNDGFYFGPLLLLALEDGRDIAGCVRDAMQGGVAASAEGALDGGVDGVGVGRGGGCFSRSGHGERWGGGYGELRARMEDDEGDGEESGDREGKMGVSARLQQSLYVSRLAVGTRSMASRAPLRSGT